MKGKEILLALLVAFSFYGVGKDCAAQSSVEYDGLSIDEILNSMVETLAEDAPKHGDGCPKTTKSGRCSCSGDKQCINTKPDGSAIKCENNDGSGMTCVDFANTNSCACKPLPDKKGGGYVEGGANY